LVGIVETSVRRHGAEVIDVLLRGDPSNRVLEVYVDSADGITIETCSQISRSIAEDAEAVGLLRGTYRLEVSSPGSDRPLKFPWQYRKHAGRRFKIPAQAATGRTTRTGVLRLADEEGIVIEEDGTRAEVRLGFDSIVEAKVVLPW
jgi:ribosome maturation factor RimP